MTTVHSLLFKTNHPLKTRISETVDDIPDTFECILCETSKPMLEFITHQYKRKGNQGGYKIHRYQYCKECRNTTYKHLNTIQLADSMMGVIANKLVELGVQYNIDRFDAVFKLIPSRLFLEAFHANAPDNLKNAVVNPTVLKKECVKAFKSLIKLYNHHNGEFVPMIQRYEALYNEAQRLDSINPTPSNIISIESPNSPTTPPTTPIKRTRVVRTRVVRQPILRAKRILPVIVERTPFEPEINQTTETLASTEN